MSKIKNNSTLNEAKRKALHMLEYVVLPKCVANETFYSLEMSVTLMDFQEMVDIEDSDDEFYDDIDFYNMQLVYGVSSTLEYHLFKFPEPVGESLAYYGMAVTWFGNSRYFTLERGKDANYICEVTTKKRDILGTFEGAVDMDEFRKHIIATYYTLPPLTDDEIETIYQKGWDCHTDERYVKAEQYYRQAAMYGHDVAQEYLGEFYMAGLGGLERDELKARMWFELSARQGNNDAKWCLSEMHKRNFRAIIDTKDDDREEQTS